MRVPALTQLDVYPVMLGGKEPLKIKLSCPCIICHTRFGASGVTLEDVEAFAASECSASAKALAEKTNLTGGWVAGPC